MEALIQGQKVESDTVQTLIQQHYDWVNQFWTPTQETYVGLGQMYLDHPEFRDFYERLHPGLAEFMVAAMKVFAKRNLS